MEVIMSSPVQEGSVMENDKGDGSVKLTKPKKKRRIQENIKVRIAEAHIARLDEELASYDKREDTASGLGKTAIVDKKMSVSSSAVTTSDVKSSISGMEIDKGIGSLFRIEASPVKVGSVIENGEGPGVKLTKSYKKRMKLKERIAAACKARFDKEQELLYKKMLVSSSAATTGDENSSISGMEIDKGDGSVKLTRSQKKKLKANVESLDKREDTGNTKSKPEVSFCTLQDNPYSGGTTAPVDQNNRVLSLSATGDEKGSNSKIEASSGEMGSSMIRSLNAEVKTQNKIETAIGETGSGINATDNTGSKKRNRRKEKNKNSESGDFLSTHENTQDKSATVDQNNRVSGSSATGDEKSSVSKIEASSGKTGSSMITNLNAEVKTQNKIETAIGETGSVINATNNTGSKKRNRRKGKNKNSESGDVLSTRENTQDKSATVDQSNRVSSLSATGDEMSSVSKIEASGGKTGSSMIASLNAEVKTQNKMETAVGETGLSTNVTDNTASKKGKRPKKKKENPESGDVLSTGENTQDKTATVDQNNRVSSLSATSDEKSSVSKIEASSGKTGSSMITSLNAEVKTQNKMETAVGKTGSGTNVTDNTASKKSKRPKKKKKNPESGDVLSTHENTQDKTATVDQNNRVSSLSATSDEKSSVSKIEVSSGKTGSSMITSLNAEAKTQNKMETAVGKTGSGTNVTDNAASKKRKWWEEKNEKKTKSKRPILGEILNPLYLESLEAGISIENMENNKRWILNKNHPASSGVLSTGESTQDTKNPLLALSTGLEREDHPKKANDEKGPSTIVDAENTMFMEVASTAEPAEAKANTTLPIKMMKQNTEVQEKKLVILDLNGLLADNVSPPPSDIMADYRIRKRAALIKRPFLDDFMSFCFERFHVGIWSSKKKKNLRPAVKFLLGDLKKLFFLWDGSKCTRSGMKTLEEKHKWLVFKDLRRIWERDGKSWVKGRFNESNTLLLDDSPYKALVNPKHSGIFPVSYSYKNRDDNFLGPKGELQNYLEGWAASENGKTYVEQHPFGQGFIDETHPNWNFYARVLQGQSR